jgi:hypothetical protein
MLCSSIHFLFEQDEANWTKLFINKSCCGVMRKEREDGERGKCVLISCLQHLWEILF